MAPAPQARPGVPARDARYQVTACGAKVKAAQAVCLKAAALAEIPVQPVLKLA
eukprot:SAG11_NODE_28550_length_320_cov_1.104072_1_plen_52_part_10